MWSPIQLLPVLNLIWSPIQLLPVLDLIKPLNLTLWPKMTSDKKWFNNFCRGSQALSYTQVTWSCYVICRRSSDFSENNLFDPCDLGWPLTRSWVIWHMRAGSLIIVTKFHWNRSKQVEGTSGYLVDRRKKELEIMSASRHWYTGAYNIDVWFLMTSENAL